MKQFQSIKKSLGSFFHRFFLRKKNNSSKRAKLTDVEKIIYNEGERLIPGVTHNEEEAVRHKSSYTFFRRIIDYDIGQESAREREGEISIVDLGCGVGHGCKTISSLQGVRMTGVDISSESIEYAHKHYGGDNIRYETSELREYIGRMEPFDYVVSRGVFEHIHDGINLIFSTKWKERLIFDVPYKEVSDNPHHVIKGISEDDFQGRENIELFYQDLDGIIYDAKHKPEIPNMIICVCSNPRLKRVSDLGICFPIPAVKIKNS